MIGGSTRDGESKLALDEDAAKVYFGREGPGPTGYHHVGAVGKQVDIYLEAAAAAGCSDPLLLAQD